MQIALPLIALCVMTVVPSGQAERNARPVINQSDDPLLGASGSARSGRRAWAAASTTSRCRRRDPNIIYRRLRRRRRVQVREQRRRRSSRCSRPTARASIGDIAIHPRDPNIVYVGTGEPNNRQTSSFGDGIYKTTDGGKTFTNIGLKETQTIARIVIDPKNPETVYVASPGHLFGPNPERGVYKTTDGGKTWNKIKFIDDDTGFTDIVLDPVNSQHHLRGELSAPPQRLLLQRRRARAAASGRATDAGKTWTKLTGNGLPPGTYGRIALDVSRSNPNVVYAQIEAGETGTPERTQPVRAAAATEATPAGAAAVTPPGAPARRARAAQRRRGAGAAAAAAGRAAAGGGGGGRGRSTTGATTPVPAAASADAAAAVAAAAQQAQPRGAARRRRRSIRRTAACSAPTTRARRGRSSATATRGRCTSASCASIRATTRRSTSPACRSRSRSTAARRSRRSTRPAATASRATSISTRSGSIRRTRSTSWNGNDGGLDISWDQGKTWDYVNTMATALAYVVTADMRHPYYVYIGLQDNGSWGGPSAMRGTRRDHELATGSASAAATASTRPSIRPTTTSSSPSRRTARPTATTCARRTRRRASVRAPAAGAADAAAAAAAAAAATRRGERPARRRRARGDRRQAAPPVQVGGQGGCGGRGGTPNVLNAQPGDSYRFNWNTPVDACRRTIRSIVWLGGNRLFKSYNRGDTWMASAGSHQADRSQHGRDDGRAGQPHAALEERRRRRPTARSSRSPNRR